MNGIKEEFTSLKVGSRNYAEDYDFTRGLWVFTMVTQVIQPAQQKVAYTISGSTNTWKQSKAGPPKTTAWII